MESENIEPERLEDVLERELEALKKEAEETNESLWGETSPLPPPPITMELHAISGEVPKPPSDIAGEIVDFSAERAEVLTSYRDLITDDTAPIGVRLSELLYAITALPNSSAQIPVIVALVMLPTAMVHTAPIGVAYGPSGSGKSELGAFIAAAHNAPILSSSTTYAGLRNHISYHKFYGISDGRGNKLERNFCCVFDDLGADTLSNQDLFTLLKSGYSRTTSLIKQATTTAGEMLEYDCFCTKFLTSIHPFWDESQFLELKRRVVIFKTEKVSSFEGVEVKEVDFSGLNIELERYWRNKAYRDVFKAHLKTLKAMKVCNQNELLATLATVFDFTTSEALDLWEEFVGTGYQSSSGDVLTNHIKRFVSGKNQVFPEELKLSVDIARSKGVLDSVKSKDIALVMQSLGYSLSTRNNDRWIWTK